MGNMDTCLSYGMVTMVIKEQHQQYGRHAWLVPEIHILLGEYCRWVRIVFTETNLLASGTNYHLVKSSMKQFCFALGGGVLVRSFLFFLFHYSLWTIFLQCVCFTSSRELTLTNI